MYVCTCMYLSHGGYLTVTTKPWQTINKMLIINAFRYIRSKISEVVGEAQNNPAVMVDHIQPATTVDLPYFTGYTQFAAWPTPQLVRNINLFNE